MTKGSTGSPHACNPNRVLAVASWLDEFAPHIDKLRNAGFDVTCCRPLDEEEPDIPSEKFDIAVVDLRGQAPARDALRVVERLIHCRSYPVVLTNTMQIERILDYLPELACMRVRRSRNVRELSGRGEELRQSDRVTFLKAPSPTDTLQTVRRLTEGA